MFSRASKERTLYRRWQTYETSNMDMIYTLVTNSQKKAKVKGAQTEINNYAYQFIF